MIRKCEIDEFINANKSHKKIDKIKYKPTVLSAAFVARYPHLSVSVIYCLPLGMVADPCNS